MTVPAANGRLHFAGEALSVRHAWIEGALDSAWRAIYAILLDRERFTDKQRKAFFERWGTNPEWIGKPQLEKEPERSDGDEFAKSFWGSLLIKHSLANHVIEAKLEL